MTLLRKSLLSALALLLGSLPADRLRASGDLAADLQQLSAAGPASAGAPTMSQDQLAAFFESLKKGARVELTLNDGKIIDGQFSSYDDYYGMVWLVSHEEGTLLNQKGLRLAGVRHATLLKTKKTSSTEQLGTKGKRIPLEKPASSDYYLIQELLK